MMPKIYCPEHLDVVLRRADNFSCHLCNPKTRIWHGRVRVLYTSNLNPDSWTPGSYGYTYKVPAGLRLQVGDVVSLPGNWLHTGGQSGSVVSFGGFEYSGVVSSILGIEKQVTPELTRKLYRKFRGL